MKYRHHSSSLEESMATEIVGVDVKAIVAYINNKFKVHGTEITAMGFKHVGFDPRVNWDTYYVIVSFDEKEPSIAVGMMALQDHEYCCYMCGQVYEKGRSDQEAHKENIQNFGVEFHFQEKQVVTCDDCFKKIDPKNHPDKVEATLKEFRKKRN